MLPLTWGSPAHLHGRLRAQLRTPLPSLQVLTSPSPREPTPTPYPWLPCQGTWRPVPAVPRGRLKPTSKADLRGAVPACNANDHPQGFIKHPLCAQLSLISRVTRSSRSRPSSGSHLGNRLRGDVSCEGPAPGAGPGVRASPSPTARPDFLTQKTERRRWPRVPRLHSPRLCNSGLRCEAGMRQAQSPGRGPGLEGPRRASWHSRGGLHTGWHEGHVAT